MACGIGTTADNPKLGTRKVDDLLATSVVAFSRGVSHEGGQETFDMTGAAFGDMVGHYSRASRLDESGLASTMEGTL